MVNGLARPGGGTSGGVPRRIRRIMYGRASSPDVTCVLLFPSVIRFDAVTPKPRYTEFGEPR